MAAPQPSIRVVLDTRGQKKAKGFCLLLLASKIFLEEKKEREVCMFFFLGNHYHQAKFSNLKITAIFQEIYVKLDRIIKKQVLFLLSSQQYMLIFQLYSDYVRDIRNCAVSILKIDFNKHYSMTLMDKVLRKK